MKSVSEQFPFHFLEEVDPDLERKKYLDELKKIAEEREKNITHETKWVRIKSPKAAYLLGNDEKVEPIYTECDGYGKVHIWKNGVEYNAGVEIEGRYILLGDELIPKIRVYNDTPESILDIIKKLKNA